MKLRIHRNSVRMRLSQSDISVFGAEGVCSEELVFSNSSLKYMLVKASPEDKIAEPIVDLEGNSVIVKVPVALVEEWLGSDMVGFHNKAFETNDLERIRILVEKDFQCLHKRPNEDETDSFPNPLAD